jgi:hypothetical protein
MWLVQLDIPEELEDEFNRIYDTEHVPYISAVPGVLDVQRYVLERPVDNVQKYATVYLVSSPDLPQSAQWRAASDRGEWSQKIRPHTANASLAMFRAIPGSPPRPENPSTTTP